MGFLSNLFGKKTGLKDYSMLSTDLHSHLIPGIDDGAETIEDSIQLIRALVDLGFTKLITTPHVMSDYYKNSREIVYAGLKQIREAAAKAGIPVTLEAGAEYYCDFEFEQKIGKEELLTFSDNHILMEISYLQAPDNLDSVLFKLQLEGYKPILAHPERYPFWYHDFEKYEALKDRGVLLQVNLASLTGYYGTGARRTAERLIDRNMVDLFATDVHKMSHIPLYQKALNERWLSHAIESGTIKNHLL
jgi:tyrosine-protein phosphatase YwqE